jgi:hypothetical protein
VDVVGESAWIGHREAVPEADQSGPQFGESEGGAPVLLGIPRQRRGREYQPRPFGMEPEVREDVAADQHPVPMPPERKRAGRVPRDLQDLEAFNDIAFRQCLGDRVSSDWQQGPL